MMPVLKAATHRMGWTRVPRAIILTICATTLHFGQAAETTAATTPANYIGASIASTEHWQRVELPSGQCPSSITSQVRVVIETKGPRLSGLVKLPGSLASNFETAKGKAVVDLINVGSNKAGFAAIAAVEIDFTEMTAGQSFTVSAVDCQTN